MPSLATVNTSSLDFEALVDAVRHNCHISDAQHAGDLTLCIFLLKMRELYRWEQGIPLGQDMPREQVGEWMNQRGRMWDEMEAAPYAPIPLGDTEVDPFEAERINTALLPQGWVYSGGYGRHCKPHFFLGRLLHREHRHGIEIRIAGREHARDLEAPPGMLLDNAITVRTEALKRWLWEKYEEWRWNRKNEAMGRAVACYPFEHDTEAALDAMTRIEQESVILHELGEARVAALLGAAWEALLLDVMRGRAEIIARAVRDLYADCLSTLPGLLEREEPAALHFYFANFVGMRRLLFPELARAYQDWVDRGTLTPLRRTAAEGLARWQEESRILLDLHREHGEAVASHIEARLAPRTTC